MNAPLPNHDQILQESECQSIKCFRLSNCRYNFGDL